jgi:hypothetical protein
VLGSVGGVVGVGGLGGVGTWLGREDITLSVKAVDTSGMTI